MAYTPENCLDQNPPVCSGSVWDSAGDVVRKLSLGFQLLLLHVHGGVYLSFYCCRSVAVVSPNDVLLSKGLLRSAGIGVI